MPLWFVANVVYNVVSAWCDVLFSSYGVNPVVVTDLLSEFALTFRTVGLKYCTVRMMLKTSIQMVKICAVSYLSNTFPLVKFLNE